MEEEKSELYKQLEEIYNSRKNKKDPIIVKSYLDDKNFNHVFCDFCKRWHIYGPITLRDTGKRNSQCKSSQSPYSIGIILKPSGNLKDNWLKFFKKS